MIFLTKLLFPSICPTNTRPLGVILVYYGVLTTTIMGQFLSLLFVSRYEEEWEDDRRELKEGYPYAYVWNREEEFGEIGCIQIKMEQGGLVRVA